MMKAIVIENNWLPRSFPGSDMVMDFGWGNGYVVLDKDHPANELHYNDIDVEIHGGLTFAGPVKEVHLSMCPELDDTDFGKWMVGFDTAHYQDTLEKWPKEAVQEEANRLMKQLIEK